MQETASQLTAFTPMNFNDKLNVERRPAWAGLRWNLLCGFACDRKPAVNEVAVCLDPL